MIYLLILKYSYFSFLLQFTNQNGLLSFEYIVLSTIYANIRKSQNFQVVQEKCGTLENIKKQMYFMQ